MIDHSSVPSLRPLVPRAVVLGEAGPPVPRAIGASPVIDAAVALAGPVVVAGIEALARCVESYCELQLQRETVRAEVERLRIAERADLARRQIDAFIEAQRTFIATCKQLLDDGALEWEQREWLLTRIAIAAREPMPALRLP